MTWSSAELESLLNEQQFAAVTHTGGPQLVLAGAGSGKTRVITYRIAWLIEDQGVDPGSIVAVTFTNKAAAEMRERVEELVSRHPLATFVGTFHRYALRLLRRYGARVGLPPAFQIVDDKEQLGLVSEALRLEELSDTAFRPRAMLSAISSAKNRLLDTRAYEQEAEGYFERKVVGVYRRYQGLLQKSGAVDFDDMISKAVELLEDDDDLSQRLRQRVKYLLVDEFQDTNHAQLRLVQALAGADGQLTAVGDEDQGIYRWRGADLDNILRFESGFPDATVRKLERNYRSTQTILDASGALVAHNEGRRGKRLWTDLGSGEAIRLYHAKDEEEEARWLASSLEQLRNQGQGLDQMAVLVRTNAQTRSLEDEFLRRNLPYELVGGTRFYDRAEIRDVVAYLRVLKNPHNDIAFSRILNQPPRGIGKNTRKLLEDRARDLGQPLWDVLRLDDLGTFPNRAAKALLGFRDLLLELQRLAEALPLPALLDQLLEATGYLKLYDANDPDQRPRLENLEELRSAAQQFTESIAYRSEDEEATDPLAAFLDRVALVSDVDGWEGRTGVSVMTLHSAKGLEFPIVALPGLEEGLLPHHNATQSPEEVEEERRLLYVGMTRARQRLLLSTCRRRRVAGTFQDRQPSRFLGEIPEKHLDVERSPSLFAREDAAAARSVYSFFQRDAGASGAGTAAPPSMPSSGTTRRSGPRTFLPRRGAPDGDELYRGRKVRHPTLGMGQILSLDGKGNAMKITVYFDRVGKRKLIARFANLELL
ncbi:MAG: UvrD-helicase domain-containing protein [Acidobacteriota bacterium]